MWKDIDNYLYVIRGQFGKNDVAIMGCIEKQNVLIGRGRLISESAVLRLEFIDNQVNALYSSNGEEWFTVRNVEFGAEYPVGIGLIAFGLNGFDRTIYQKAYPEGTAIRFESFELLG